MAVVALLVVTGLILIGTGFTRGNVVALILGAVLMADAMALYVVFGPAAAFTQTLFPAR